MDKKCAKNDNDCGRNGIVNNCFLILVLFILLAIILGAVCI